MKRHVHRLLSILGWGLLVALIAWRASTLLRYDLWYDELYSLYTASGDLGQLWQAAVQDRVHPPLFYLTLWAWLQAIEPTPTLLRLLPFATWLGLLVATWWAAGAAGLVRRRRLLAVVLVAGNPIVWDAAAEVRGYALLAALVAALTGALLHLLRLTGPRHARAILIGAAVAATWVHYFAWPTVAAAMAILWWHDRRRDAAWLGVITVAAALPWGWALWASRAEGAFAQQLAWGTAPGWQGWALLPGSVLAGRAPMLAQVGVAALGWTMLLLAARTREQRPFVALAVAPPLAALIGSMVLGLTIWDMRYFIGATVPLAFLLAWWSDSDRPAVWVAVTAIFVLGAWGALSPATWRIPWRAITAAVSGDEPVYAFDGFAALPLRYYALTAGRAVDVPEIKAWPDAATPPGWLVVRPIMFPDTPHAGDRLRAVGRTVVDSLVSGDGSNRVEAWRFR